MTQTKLNFARRLNLLFQKTLQLPGMTPNCSTGCAAAVARLPAAARPKLQTGRISCLRSQSLGQWHRKRYQAHMEKFTEKCYCPLDPPPAAL